MKHLSCTLSATNVLTVIITQRVKKSIIPLHKQFANAVKERQDNSTMHIMMEVGRLQRHIKIGIVFPKQTETKNFIHIRCTGIHLCQIRETSARGAFSHLTAGLHFCVPPNRDETSGTEGGCRHVNASFRAQS